MLTITLSEEARAALDSLAPRGMRAQLIEQLLLNAFLRYQAARVP